MLIELHHVHKSYGRSKALKDINLSLERGHIYGLVGANGAGKSSLIRLITGFHYPSSGTVKVLSHDMRREPELALAKIGYCPEHSPLYPDMTILEYLTFIGQAKGLKGTRLKESLSEVIDAFDLKSSQHKLTQTLSHGFRQRTALAQAFLGNPELVVLDEPTNGLDPTQIISFRHFLKRKSAQMSLFFSSHVLSEVEHICDTLIMIVDGELKAVGAPSQIAHDHSIFNRLEVYLSHPDGIAFKVLQKSPAFNLLELQDVPDGVKLLVELKPNKTEADLLDWVRKHRLILKSMIPQNQRIESLFHEITRGDKS